MLPIYFWGFCFHEASKKKNVPHNLRIISVTHCIYTFKKLNFKFGYEFLYKFNIMSTEDELELQHVLVEYSIEPTFIIFMND